MQGNVLYCDIIYDMIYLWYIIRYAVSYNVVYEILKKNLLKNSHMTSWSYATISTRCHTEKCDMNWNILTRYCWCQVTRVIFPLMSILKGARATLGLPISGKGWYCLCHCPLYSETSWLQSYAFILIICVHDLLMSYDVFWYIIPFIVTVLF
jgi:hypothetical protein